MNALVIEKQSRKVKNGVRAVLALYFVIFCGYFVFSEAAVDRYGSLFYLAALGTVLALLFFLSNTLWAPSTRILTIDSATIDSNIRSHKFKAEWVHVSKVTISEGAISIFVDGGRKERVIDLSSLQYKDIKPIKDKVAELCEHKSIVCGEG